MTNNYYLTNRNKALVYQRLYRQRNAEQLRERARLPIEFKRNLTFADLEKLMAGETTSYVLTPAEILMKYNRRRKKGPPRSSPPTYKPSMQIVRGDFEVRFD